MRSCIKYRGSKVALPGKWCSNSSVPTNHTHSLFRPPLVCGALGLLTILMIEVHGGLIPVIFRNSWIEILVSQTYFNAKARKSNGIFLDALTYTETPVPGGLPILIPLLSSFSHHF